MTALFITILNMSITASIVALAVMLARIPLRKAPKIFSYALWGVVLFRLVFPFSIESIFSLMPTATNAIPHDIVVSQNPTIQTGLQFIDLPVNAAINNALPPVITEYSANPIQVVLGIAGYVWLIGFTALLLYAAIGYVRLKRRVYFATLVRDNIFETDKIKSPFVLGFIRPKIYFPTTINPTQYGYILKHEQTHIKRRDYLVKPFAYIVFALHWFNPLMWVSYFLMSKDMEMSCDESVIRNTSEDIRGDYSASLLSLAVEKNILLNPIAFAFGESNVKERVVNVLSFKKHSKWVIAITFVAVSVFLIGFISNRAVFAEIPNELNNIPDSNTARSNNVIIENPPSPNNINPYVRTIDDWITVQLVEDYAFVEMSLAIDRAWAEQQVVESGNRADRREWADEWIASRYESAEEWIASRHEWAAEIRDLYDNGLVIVIHYENGNIAIIENSINIDTNQNRRSSVVIFAEYEEWGITLEGLYPQSDGRFLATEIQNVFFQGQLIRGVSDFGHGVDMSISSFDRGHHMWIHVIRDVNGNIERLDLELSKGLSR